MRTEQELRRAQELFAWYVNSPRIHRQEPAVQHNVLGVIATIEWALGTRIGRNDNPVAGTLRDIEEMQRLDGRHETN